ncbi:MAG: hypothetical protein ACRELS_06095 [Candidatus Rokuibacteriota bacterium]
MAEASATRIPPIKHRAFAGSHRAGGARVMGRDRGAAHERVDLGVGPAVGPRRRLSLSEPVKPLAARKVAPELGSAERSRTTPRLSGSKSLALPMSLVIRSSRFPAHDVMTHGQRTDAAAYARE